MNKNFDMTEFIFFSKTLAACKNVIFNRILTTFPEKNLKSEHPVYKSVFKMSFLRQNILNELNIKRKTLVWNIHIKYT